MSNVTDAEILSESDSKPQILSEFAVDAMNSEGFETKMSEAEGPVTVEPELAAFSNVQKTSENSEISSKTLSIDSRRRSASENDRIRLTNSTKTGSSSSKNDIIPDLNVISADRDTFLMPSSGGEKSKSLTDLCSKSNEQNLTGTELLVFPQNVDSVSLEGSGNELEPDFGVHGLAHSASEVSSLSRQLTDGSDTADSVLLRSPEGTSAVSSALGGCEMCANYEIHLQQAQDTERSLKQQLNSAQHLADRYRTELSGERLFRSELETKMTKLSGETVEKLEKLVQSVERFEKSSETSDHIYQAQLKAVKAEFRSIRKADENLSAQMTKLRAEYDRLLGKHRQEAETMQREAIEVPQSVDELQLFCLQLREELIETRAAKEHLEDSLKSEVLFLKEQLTGETQAKDQLEENLMEEVNNLRTELGITQSQVSDLQEKHKRSQELERQMAEYQTTVGDLETKLTSLQTDKGELDFKVREYRKKTLAMQQELDNCEAVQRDFVKLSQSLQIELEKIRQAEQEVRWQEDEDVVLCGKCKEPFTKNRHRQHCRHCGKIFCGNCLPKTVPSGPQRRPARVCEVCHTLLVRDTAPYFSETAPTGN